MLRVWKDKSGHWICENRHKITPAPLILYIGLDCVLLLLKIPFYQAEEGSSDWGICTRCADKRLHDTTAWMQEVERIRRQSRGGHVAAYP